MFWRIVLGYASNGKKDIYIADIKTLVLFGLFGRYIVAN